jgi:hypothetical protein
MRRDPRLVGLSSDHHHALVLAREAQRASVAGDPWLVTSVAKRVHDAFVGELEPHFVIEEEILLPALEAVGEHALVARVREDHAALRLAQHAEGLDTEERLAAFAAKLEAHVRFEERELFEAAQAKLGDDVLDAVAARGASSRACAVKA